MFVTCSAIFLGDVFFQKLDYDQSYGALRTFMQNNPFLWTKIHRTLKSAT
jgi:hypothetical protein